MDITTDSIRAYIDHPVTTASSETDFLEVPPSKLLSLGALGERARLKHLMYEGIK